jgi:starch-binding outer membrane protein, SusD/RagB family
MTSLMKRAAVALLATVAVACTDYLSGPGLTISPNLPVTASKEQFFAAVAASQQTQEEGLLARLAAMFTQQMAGTGRQHATMQLYSITETDITSYMSRTYTGGGLVDVRQAQALAKTQGDSVFAGVAMVYEALMIGRAASIWGDIPYSEAVSDIGTPKLDSQELVYAAVQAKLDTAISWIPKTGGPNIGPGAVDLVYGGDRAKWVAAANTLKARLYMHWVEAQLAGASSATLANVACGGNCLQKAVTAATAGIQSSANDFRMFHSGTSTEWNLWYQFLAVVRTGDVASSRTLVDTLKGRRTTLGDQRLRAYYDSVLFQGTLDFRGADRNGAATPGGSPLSVLSAARLANSYRQPIITAAENFLWLAEAQARLGASGPALTALNQAKAASAALNGVAVPAAAAGLTGAALLNEIKMEEWISLFQNIEVWNAYKRNCTPKLTAAGTATDVPGRLVYGLAEHNANPNIPSLSQQPSRNKNDPKACSDASHP